MERRKICRYFERGACRKDNCPFTHLKENRKICNFYQEGFCRKGAACNFYHPPKEEQKLAKLKEELKTNNNKKKEQKKEQSEEQETEEPVKQQIKEQHSESDEEHQHEQCEKKEQVQQIKIEPKIEETEVKLELNEKIEKINYLLGIHQQSESDESDEDESSDEQEEIEKKDQIQFVKIYLKKFPDFSKTPQFKALVLKNQETYFKGEKYLTLINKITDQYQKQYYQIIRKFTDSFHILGQNPKHYQIKIRPLLYDKQINIHFDFLEDTLNVEIDSRQYPEKRAIFAISNPSIPQEYKQKFVQILNKVHSTKSIFETLKLIQNNFQKLYGDSKFKLQNQYYSKKQHQRKLKEQKKQRKQLAAKGVIEGEKPEVRKKRIKKQMDEHPDLTVIRYMEGERIDHINFNYQVSVQSIILQGCEYIVVEKMLIYIECVCQKKIVYIIDAAKDRSLVVGVKLKCKKCQNLMTLGFERQVVQARKDILGTLGINGGHIVDIGGVGFKIGCICNNQISKGRLFLPGERVSANCHNCFQTMMVNFMGLKLYNPTLKTPQVRVDHELPNKGSCKHMKLSFRWFRYGCCGRCFSCDDCHIMESIVVHQKLRGITMLCGFCSREQPIANQCYSCHKQIVKGVDKSGHWEGGLGCRDQTLLSKKDGKKYTGLTKKK